MADCEILPCCPPSIYGYEPSFTATVTYTATCPIAETGQPVSSTKTATSNISYQDAYDAALAEATEEAEAALVCDLIVYPVTFYRTGGVGTVGALGCGLHMPAIATMAGPGGIVIPGEGVRASNGYSAYEVQGFDSLNRPVFSAVAQNNFNGINVQIIVSSDDFDIDFPCAATPAPPWCGCFSLP